MWLKDEHSWTKRQIAQHHELSRMHLKTGRAFRMKETLRDIFATATTRAEAEEQLTAWAHRRAAANWRPSRSSL